MKNWPEHPLLPQSVLYLRGAVQTTASRCRVQRTNVCPQKHKSPSAAISFALFAALPLFCHNILASVIRADARATAVRRCGHMLRLPSLRCRVAQKCILATAKRYRVECCLPTTLDTHGSAAIDRSIDRPWGSLVKERTTEGGPEGREGLGYATIGIC